MRGNPYASASKLWFDTFVDQATVGDQATPYVKRSLNLIPLNAGSSGRRGAHIRVLNLNIHGRFRGEGNATASAGFDPDQTRIRLRFIVYYDTSNNSDPARVNPALLLAGDPGASGVAKVDSFRNMVQTKDFKILHDKIITLEPEQVAVRSDGVILHTTRARDFRVSKKLNLDVDFTEPESGDPTLSNIPNGNFGVIAFTDGGNTKAACYLTFCARLKYSTNWPWN